MESDSESTTSSQLQKNEEKLLALAKTIPAKTNTAPSIIKWLAIPLDDTCLKVKKMSQEYYKLKGSITMLQDNQEKGLYPKSFNCLTPPSTKTPALATQFHTITVKAKEECFEFLIESMEKEKE